MMNGTGIMVWEDGSRYEGYWFNNLRHGKGKYWYSDGRFEVQDWINGKR